MGYGFFFRDGIVLYGEVYVYDGVGDEDEEDYGGVD